MSSKIKSSIGLRLVLIAGLSLLLLIPALMIESLISDRELRRDEAVKEVNDKWGMSQVIAGPVLTIPFKKHYIVGKTESTSEEYLHILPEYLTVDGKLYPDIRYRGIYKSILYNTGLNIQGKFILPDFKELKIPETDINWDDAFICMNISDMKGIRDEIKIIWNGKEHIGNPGLKSTDVLLSGITTKIELEPKSNVYNFESKLNINGSDELNFIPLGKETIVKLNSNWGNPSFTGNFLPVKRHIGSNEFRSEWKVLNLNRNYPQYWINSQYKIFESSFGVKILLPIDEYQKTMRTSKYAIMFIGLTFLAFFVIEILNKKHLHPVQYLLIGFALVLFYTLLLALSEYISFNISYWCAAAAITALIGGYSKSILASVKLSFNISAILLILYGFLFIILQLQDYALLFGSIGLFLILSVVMYITRKIDWFSIGHEEKEGALS